VAAPATPSGPPAPPLHSDGKVANRNVRDFGWEIAHAAVSRRPPISLSTMVPRAGGDAFEGGVWDWSIVQGQFSVAPCQTLTLRFAFFSSLYAVAPMSDSDFAAAGFPATGFHSKKQLGLG
jgi:hypothetical protein